MFWSSSSKIKINSFTLRQSTVNKDLREEMEKEVSPSENGTREPVSNWKLHSAKESIRRFQYDVIGLSGEIENVV